MRFLDIDLEGKSVFMCGNYGDPIYHPRFAELCGAFRQRGCRIRIVTNGSHRNQQWWQQVCDELTDQDEVTFSIDGVPENFTQYRINADWGSIEQGIRTCVSRNIPTIWKFIPFSFNQHSLDAARSLSRDLGMYAFQVEHSDRFDTETQHLKPTAAMLGDRIFAQTQLVQGGTLGVDPDCHKSGNTYFVSATGHFAMCCYLADHRFFYKTDFGRDRASYDIRAWTLTQILQRPSLVTWFKSIPLAPESGCQFNCPKRQTKP